MQGWGYDFTHFNYIHLCQIGARAVFYSSEGWHGIALTCKDVQLKSFRWEHLLICSASAPPLGNEAEILKTEIKTKLFSQSLIQLCCLTGRKNNGHLSLLSWLTIIWIQMQLSPGPPCVPFSVSVWNINSCCHTFISMCVKLLSVSLDCFILLILYYFYCFLPMFVFFY